MDDQKEEGRRTMSKREKACAIGALLGLFVGILAYEVATQDSYIPSPAALGLMMCMYPAIGAVLGSISGLLFVLIFDYFSQQ